MQDGKKCCCPCHWIKGALIMAFGLVFLLNALGKMSNETLSIVWPIIIMVAGVKKMIGNRCKCCAEACGPKAD